MSEFEFDHVLIVGNGFDLNLGLPTRYSDFIESDIFLSLDSEVSSYMSSIDSKMGWVDIEEELISLSSSYKNDDLSGSAVGKSFRDGFKNLRSALLQYMCQIDYSYMESNCEAIELVSSFAGRDNVCIIDFNYTETIQRLFGNAEHSIKHIKVHGSAKEGRIVFGVHDEAKIEDEHVFLRKAVSGSLFDESSVGAIMCNARESVTIFGHSLGITDNTQFDQFFHRGKNKKKCNLDVHYHNEDSYYNLYKNIDYLTINELQGFKFQHNFRMLGPDLEDV